MSDEESSDEEMSDNDQPPALEDADIDDLSSGASVVSDSSDSVSLQTTDEEDQSRVTYESTEGSMDDKEHNPIIGKPDFHDSTVAPSFILPLNLGSESEEEEGEGDDTTGTGEDGRGSSSPQGRLAKRSLQDKEDALERNSMRRQASNEMLAAMQAATRQEADETTPSGRQFERRPPPRTKSGDGMGDESGPRRRPPPRTKSGEMMNGNGDSDDRPRRRPPPRTKSGDGMDAPTRRRPPPRTKSGDGFNAGQTGMDRPARRRSSIEELGEPTESGDFVVPLQGASDDDADMDVLISPSGRRRRTPKEREEAISRNAVRRQQSSDMLAAMRAATRSAPARAKSSGAALMRKAPPRTKSGDGLNGASDHRQPRRRPPPRTKSGDGLQGESSSTPPRRRPPQRTKSGEALAAHS